jgi:Transposase DDE domain group 1
MRHVVSGRTALPEKQAASSSEVDRFETEMLSTKRNLTALMNLSGQWVDAVHRRRPLRELILDLDSSVSETYGKQECTANNGHFECTCYHPLFLFNQFGDLEWAPLRRGNHASAKFWRRTLLPVIERYRHCDIPKFFRGDTAFANPALYRLLEKEGYRYAIRLKADAVLEREIAPLLTRLVGLPWRKPKVFYQSFQYQAKSWRHSRRVVAKVEWHQGELFPRVGFIVTNLTWRSQRVVKFYNGRGTAEQWIKEVKNAMKWTKLSCRTFRDNQPPPATLRVGLQPRQLPAAAGPAKTGTTLVANDATREAHQDRSQGDAALEVRDVPTSRDGGDAKLVCRDSRPHYAAGDPAAGGRGACLLSGSGGGKRGSQWRRSARIQRLTLENHLDGPVSRQAASQSPGGHPENVKKSPSFRYGSAAC